MTWSSLAPSSVADGDIPKRPSLARRRSSEERKFFAGVSLVRCQAQPEREARAKANALLLPQLALTFP